MGASFSFLKNKQTNKQRKKNQQQQNQQHNRSIFDSRFEVSS